MKKIGLIGYGELGQQVFNFLAHYYNNNTEYFYFDDDKDSYSLTNCFSFCDYKLDDFADLTFFVCLGYKHLRLKVNIIKDLQKLNRSVLSFIHSTVYKDSTIKMGHGSIIYPGCIIDKDVVIKDGVLINNSVTLSHNCVISDGCYISPGVVISGKVIIGENTFIGSGSIVSNNITIGSDCIIGVGSVITKNIPNNSSVIGNPMKYLSKPLNLL